MGSHKKPAAPLRVFGYGTLNCVYMRVDESCIKPAGAGLESGDRSGAYECSMRWSRSGTGAFIAQLLRGCQGETDLVNLVRFGACLRVRNP